MAMSTRRRNRALYSCIYIVYTYNMIIDTNIQKWGNSLALRVTGAMREIPGLTDGTPVRVEITDDGFSVKRAQNKPKKSIADKLKEIMPYTEEELIAGMRDHYDDPDILQLSSAEIDEIWGPDEEYEDLYPKEA